MESKLKKLEKLGKRRIPRLTRKGKIRTKRHCANQSQKASQDAIVKKHAILAEIGEEEQHVICIDDVTGKELLWHEVRKSF